MFRRDASTIVVFIELKSRRGVASKVQKQIRLEMLPTGAKWWMARSARGADGAAPVRRRVPAQMAAGAAQALGGPVRRPAGAARGGRARRGTQAMARASACARGRDVGGGAQRCRGMCTAMD